MRQLSSSKVRLCAIPAERGQVENASICNNWQLQVWSQRSLRWRALRRCSQERLIRIKRGAPTASHKFSVRIKIRRIGRGCRRHCRRDPVCVDLMLMSVNVLKLLREAVLWLLCERWREGATELVFGRSGISHYLQQASLSLLRHSKLALVGLWMTQKGNNSG